MPIKNLTNLKKGDIVGVTVGKDKGKTGKIIEVSRINNRVVVEALNIRHKFEKKRGNQAGSKISFPAPMPASKVILICPNCGKATRIGHHILENGTKQRICRKCKKAI
jgi:large subunit ribosomal protein L24